MGTPADKKESLKTTTFYSVGGEKLPRVIILEVPVSDKKLPDIKKSTPSRLLVGVEGDFICGTLF